MKHRVIALDTYKKLSVSDKVLNIVPEEGFEFEVDDERLETLLGNNKFKVPFVKEVITKKKAKRKVNDNGVSN